MKDSIPIHNQKDFEGMRVAGRIAAEVLDFITDHVKVGVTTDHLNTLCHDMIIKAGCIPAPLGYKSAGRTPYPKSICTSVNHVVCHGIPSDKKLNDGDIVNIDVTVIKDGYYGDTSRMYVVGDKASIKAKKLVQVTYECLMKGIEQVRPGAQLNLIGKTIQEYAEKQGFSVVRDFCGHGIGKVFHAAPNVTHYYEPSLKLVLEEGMFFTIEPMINAGRFEVKELADGWTAVTRDKSLSAQFEHTIAVTKDGFEIFTLSPKGFTQPPYK
jgi:methionyl aminopeptidase